VREVGLSPFSVEEKWKSDNTSMFSEALRIFQANTVYK